jgi:hypothetical protein
VSEARSHRRESEPHVELILGGFEQMSRINAWLSGGAILSLAVVGISQPAHPQALEGPVYLETYDRETDYPTSPEIDRLRLGGMIGYSRPITPPKPVPSLGDDVALAQAVSVGGLLSANNEISATAVSIQDLISRGDPFAAFGHFDSFRVTPANDPSSFGAGGLTAVYVTAPNGYAVSAFVFQFVGQTGQKSATFGIQENNRIREYRLPIDVSVEGVPFDLVLVIDPTGAGTAMARLTVGGQVLETELLDLLNYQGQPLNFLSQAVLIQNNTGNRTLDWGAGDTVSAEFRGLCISGLADRFNVCPALDRR